MASDFKLSSIAYKTVRSGEIGSTAPPVRVGISSAYIECVCGNSWAAHPGNGIDGVLGGVLVTCPVCRKSERIGGHDLGM